MLTRALWQSLEGISAAFDLTEKELQSMFGGISLSVLQRGLVDQDVEVSDDVVDRVSLLLAIYKSLHVLFDDPRQANGWIDRANTLAPFDGKCPRTLIVDGNIDSLASVHTFLEYWKT